MFNQVLSATIAGVDVIPVTVEADVSNGLPVFVMVGYLSSQVKEAQDRVRTAMRNIGIALPPKRITINLAPADVRKDGSRFDLPIAAAILAATGNIPEKSLEQVMIIGELSLNGEVHGIPGVLPSVIQARECGCKMCIIPYQNRREGTSIGGIRIVGVRSLQEMLALLRDGVIPQEEGEVKEAAILPDPCELDFSDIQGQDAVKRAAVIAVAGFHNLLMVGPPGSGKTMVARRIPTILPGLTEQESLEISKIYSIAGLLPEDAPILGIRPFRSPHHTVSPQALAGGGKVPTPGEITLAHRGVLFLDEMPEFSKRALEILRQPLEDREITIARTSGTFRFPAHFLLLAAMNPCPCGFYPDMNRCTCKAGDVSRYMNKISNPLLDRIDLSVEVPAVSYRELTRHKKEGQTSADIRKEVEAARQIQKIRFAGGNLQFNSEIPAKDILRYCPMSARAEQLLEKAYKKLNFSARGYHRIVKVARTIADLEGMEEIQDRHISEAIGYRSMDKKYWRA